jgi:hypothetical protein
MFNLTNRPSGEKLITVPWPILSQPTTSTRSPTFSTAGGVTLPKCGGNTSTGLSCIALIDSPQKRHPL